jgi:hypothetical protein
MILVYDIMQQLRTIPSICSERRLVKMPEMLGKNDQKIKPTNILKIKI